MVRLNGRRLKSIYSKFKKADLSRESPEAFKSRRMGFSFKIRKLNGARLKGGLQTTIAGAKAYRESVKEFKKERKEKQAEKRLRERERIHEELEELKEKEELQRLREQLRKKRGKSLGAKFFGVR